MIKYLLLIIHCIASLNVAADQLPTWTLARGDSGASGAVAARMPDNLKLLWEHETAEAIETTPVCDGERVFVTDVMGGIEALKLNSGDSIWRREFETGFGCSPSLYLPAAIRDNSEPAIAKIPIIDVPVTDIDDGTDADPSNRSDTALLVVGDVEGNVYGMNPQTGETIWKYATEGEISAAPSFFAVPREDSFEIRVLQTSQDGSLYCLAAHTGKLLWKYESGDQIRCSATIASGKTFLGGCDGGLHIIDLATGKATRDPLPLGGPTGSTPAISGEEVFVPIMDGVLYAFNPTSGDVIWKFEDPDRPQEYRSSVAIGTDRIVVASTNKHVDAINRTTGERIWRKTLLRRADASPLIAGDEVWIASTDGELLRLSLADGEQVWSFEARGKFIAGPALVGNRLIIADDDGIVRCFGP